MRTRGALTVGNEIMGWIADNELALVRCEMFLALDLLFAIFRLLKPSCPDIDVGDAVLPVFGYSICQYVAFVPDGSYVIWIPQ